MIQKKITIAKLKKYKAKTKLRKGDEVIVITGKDKGKKGKIEKIDRIKMAITIPGVNMVKKHKKSQGQVKKPEIIEKNAPIHISNVMLVDPKSGEPTRIGYKFDESGKKVRYAKKSGTILKRDTGIKEKKEKEEKENKDNKE